MCVGLGMGTTQISYNGKKKMSSQVRVESQILYSILEPSGVTKESKRYLSHKSDKGVNGSTKTQTLYPSQEIITPSTSTI